MSSKNTGWPDLRYPDRLTQKDPIVPDPTQLPHLLKLFDDESPIVQSAVAEALCAFGNSLEQELAKLAEPPTAEQLQKVRLLLKTHSVLHENVATGPLFQPGQLVQHRRYNYRGVVVDFDLSCQADDTWYSSNRTQPDRHQPWYHILVHDTAQITYAAQTSLEQDNSGKEIVHPLLTHLFSAFENGYYIRSDRPWPDQ